MLNIKIYLVTLSHFDGILTLWIFYALYNQHDENAEEAEPVQFLFFCSVEITLKHLPFFLSVRYQIMFQVSQGEVDNRSSGLMR